MTLSTRRLTAEPDVNPSLSKPTRARESFRNASTAPSTNRREIARTPTSAHGRIRAASVCDSLKSVSSLTITVKHTVPSTVSMSRTRSASNASISQHNSHVKLMDQHATGTP
jgi:hypothetical protein